MKNLSFFFFIIIINWITSASSSAAPVRTLTVLVTIGSPPFPPGGYSVTSTISVTIVSVTSVTSVTSRVFRGFQDQGLPESLLCRLALLSTDPYWLRGDLLYSGILDLLGKDPLRGVFTGDGVLRQALSRVLVVVTVGAGELLCLSGVGVCLRTSSTSSFVFSSLGGSGSGHSLRCW